MEENYLTLKEAVKIINSCFADDEPIFIVESGQFKAATSDWRERLKLKEMEMGYRK
ncbi:hypothetical protein QMA60_05560 [Leuconostoc suionicum]|uniref:hypothetical protein n=1 Tax=Leuconostoc suionicum TaxID=1511761 RepID=UPI0024AD961F|nr:hypothetical protein [Leuconostoc suionicum]MDI6498158.1 hypothetical protein [Leuconostoc suionicum]MDI6500146.1 hypothetical protein [Leuconostoc suionicum]MDI6502263.1 hypothetical protein [Leuconostoc suionicum]MDI6614129.1 hypothetical protein [Leuconostoc suionicum]MDI6665083.1 hypothetical protein [Leuconostoc suionicum]